jgi:hypothetical protein
MKDIRAVMGPILYHIRVTEFQKRGLPHEHIAVALKNVPKSPAEIDKLLSAELPRDPGPLRDSIKRHMTHSRSIKVIPQMWLAPRVPIRLSKAC